MKAVLILSATALLAGACATTADTQLAQAECKATRPTTSTYAATGRSTKPYDRLDQRYAEMQLASSDFRMRELARTGLSPTNTVEQALRDCEKQ